MQALRATWPDITVMVLHGPYLSDARTPPAVTNGQGVGDASDLSGHFFVGLRPGFRRDGGGGRRRGGLPVPDAAGLRDLLRLAQAAAVAAARARGGTPAGPARVAGELAGQVSIGFGLYDLAWKPGYPMDPGILRSTLANALARADDLVWLFTEGNGSHQYLVPGGIDPAWLDAIAAARGLPSGLSARR